MTGWSYFAMLVMAVAITILWDKVRRLHYRLAVVEHVQMKQLLGEQKGADAAEGQAIVEELMEAIKYNKGGFLDAAKEALKN